MEPPQMDEQWENDREKLRKDLFKMSKNVKSKEEE